MSFQELNEKLNELQSEVGKVKSASEHIEEAKKAAQAAIAAAEKITSEFRKHLTTVTNEVDKILKPHKELIETTKKLKTLLIVTIVVGLSSIIISVITLILKGL